MPDAAPEHHRSATWPPSRRPLPRRGGVGAISDSGSRSTPSDVPLSKPLLNNEVAFEFDLNKNPDAYFITQPEAMEYRYQYNWDDDDSDEDDQDEDDFEWNAGITDFALFNNDRRAAQEAHKELPSRWNDMLSSQTSALQRAAQRAHDASEPGWHSTSPPSHEEHLPGLTPDHSPHLRDEMEMDNTPPSGALPVPNYLTITVTPPVEDGKSYMDDEDVDDGDDRTGFTFGRRYPVDLASSTHRPQRPGLRNARTMSGKAHSWRRPDWEIYPVGEDADAERQAELSSIEDGK